MEPYTKPGERRTGENRPRIQHLPPGQARETSRSQRQNEKRQVAAERRAIKKSARRHLKEQLRGELESNDKMSP